MTITEAIIAMVMKGAKIASDDNNCYRYYSDGIFYCTSDENETREIDTLKGMSNWIDYEIYQKAEGIDKKEKKCRTPQQKQF